MLRRRDLHRIRALIRENGKQLRDVNHDVQVGRLGVGLLALAAGESLQQGVCEVHGVPGILVERLEERRQQGGRRNHVDKRVDARDGVEST